MQRETAPEVRPRAYRVAIVVYALLVAGLGFSLVGLVTGWFEGDERQIHRLHDTAWGIFGTIVLTAPVVATWRDPARNLAPVQIALLAGPVMVVALALSSAFRGFAFLVLAILIVPAGLLAAFHPARPRLLRPEVRPSPVLLVVAVAAAVPLVAYALGQAEIGRVDTTSAHAEEFHWSTMAAIAIGVAVAGVLAGLRTSGWRILARAAGASAAARGGVPRPCRPRVRPGVAMGLGHPRRGRPLPRRGGVAGSPRRRGWLIRAAGAG